jgi:molybdopterin/thiamine biosynthesis adenylyltransferase
MFSRHHRLQNFGEEKQDLLKTKKVLIVGCGGLGCSATINLACSGIGSLTLIDDDKIDISNLHRQHAFTHEDIGKWKAEILSRECKRRNPNINIYVVLKRFDDQQIGLIKNHDVVLDCSDNASTRLLLSTECQKAKVILVFGSAISYDGQCAIIYPEGPGIKDILPGIAETTDTCDGLGVFGPVPVFIGCMQSIECIKLLTRSSHISKNATTLSCYSALNNQMFSVQIEKSKENKEVNEEQTVVFQNFEKTWDEYLMYSEPKMLLDIRKNIPEDQELMNAVCCDEEELNFIINEKNTTFFVICELGERSKILVQRLVQNKNEKNFNQFYSIKAGTKGLF